MLFLLNVLVAQRHQTGTKGKLGEEYHTSFAQPLSTVQRSLSKARLFTWKLLLFPKKKKKLLYFLEPEVILGNFWSKRWNLKHETFEKNNQLLNYFGPSSDLLASSLICAEHLTALVLNDDKYQCPNPVATHDFVLQGESVQNDLSGFQCSLIPLAPAVAMWASPDYTSVEARSHTLF